MRVLGLCGRSPIPLPNELWIGMSNWFARPIQIIRFCLWPKTSFKLDNWPRPRASTRDWVSVAHPSRGRSTLPVPADHHATLLPPPSLSCSVISVALGATPYEPAKVLPPSSPLRRTLCRPLMHWCLFQHSRWPFTFPRQPSNAPLWVVTWSFMNMSSRIVRYMGRC